MSSPFETFQLWLSEAEKDGQVEPIAMTLSTVNEKGAPTSRVVLLRKIQDDTFYFFTNYNSAKAKMLLDQKQACVNFHWRLPFHRQVRIEGAVAKASAQISDEYFYSRPRGSQIGAWASPQSQAIENRAELEARVEQYEKQFAGKDVPRPEYWGGFGLQPQMFEFWQEGESRLHTRQQFLKTDKGWQQKLLAP